jgi:phosphatidylglycerophosphate synthase
VKRARIIVYLPNALSASRFALAAAWITFAASGVAARVPYVVLVLAAWATDFLDGYLARRFEAASSVGRWLDAFADVAFVLAALGAEAALGAIPYYIPVLIGASFSQYAIDSLLITSVERGLIRSRLGHLGGMINYALVIALAVTPPPSAIGNFVRDLCPLIAVFYIAAIAERGWLLYRSH